MRCIDPRPRRGVMRWRAATAVLFAGMTLLAGCQASKDVGDSIFGRGPGLEAALRPSGSAAKGTVRMFDYRDGVTLQLSLYNVPVGTYRIALHENGNCRSPNLFSAGPAWAPPGAGKSPADLLPEFVTNTEGDVPTYTAFIRGARADDGPGSLRGRSVVIHFGPKIADAFPGQPNNRMACGVLEPITSPF
jgi:Cu/Zn superoxide dismutase